ncbi:MocR-like ectoine utilization transcription factor EhuR [Halovulum marinum]|nr:PLP-dependent aminotransferase family protein [Halovulum marinum]
MTIWPPRPGSLQRPAYRSLVQLIEAAIDSGELKPGQKLPTHRQLAFDLGLSVQTVSRAYDKLVEAGKVQGEVGRGTFVRALSDDLRVPFVSHRTAGRLIDMSILKPVVDHTHKEAFQKALRDIARSVPDAVLGAFRAGTLLDRDHGAVARWLALCGLTAPPSAVVPTNGGTAAMTVALMTAAHSGDLVVAEEIGHHTLRPLTRYLGLRLRGLETDKGGIRPEAFAAACRAEPVKVLHLMPTGLNPLGFTMSSRRREALVEIARRHDVLIVENHSSGPLHEAAPPPLAVLAPERVLFFTSLTKCVLPGLRIGFLVVPNHLGAAAANRHLVTSWMATSLAMEIALRWIETGTAERLLQRQRVALGDRADFAASVLSPVAHRISPSGLHAWLPCADVAQEDALAAAARDAGVAVARAGSFAIGAHDRHPGLRLALGGQSFPDFARGLRIVARLASEHPEAVVPQI